MAGRSDESRVEGRWARRGIEWWAELAWVAVDAVGAICGVDELRGVEVPHCEVGLRGGMLEDHRTPVFEAWSDLLVSTASKHVAMVFSPKVCDGPHGGSAQEEDQDHILFGVDLHCRNLPVE